VDGHAGAAGTFRLEGIVPFAMPVDIVGCGPDKTIITLAPPPPTPAIPPSHERASGIAVAQPLPAPAATQTPRHPAAPRRGARLAALQAPTATAAPATEVLPGHGIPGAGVACPAVSCDDECTQLTTEKVRAVVMRFSNSLVPAATPVAASLIAAEAARVQPPPHMGADSSTLVAWGESRLTGVALVGGAQVAVDGGALVLDNVEVSGCPGFVLSVAAGTRTTIRSSTFRSVGSPREFFVVGRGRVELGEGCTFEGLAGPRAQAPGLGWATPLGEHLVLPATPCAAPPHLALADALLLADDGATIALAPGEYTLPGGHLVERALTLAVDISARTGTGATATVTPVPTTTAGLPQTGRIVLRRQPGRVMYALNAIHAGTALCISGSGKQMVAEGSGILLVGGGATAILRGIVFTPMPTQHPQRDSAILVAAGGRLRFEVREFGAAPNGDPFPPRVYQDFHSPCAVCQPFLVRRDVISAPSWALLYGTSSS